MQQISYFSRDFRGIRQEVIDFIKKNYPDTISSFNDASIGSLLIDILCGVSDNLSYNIDRAQQETHIDYAQERGSLLSKARTYGLKIPFKRGSVSLVDFTVTVPVKATAPDLTYAPIILRGCQVLGGGTIFETNANIDFASPYSDSGIPNRTIIPNYSNTGNIDSYNITKRELVYNGRTKIFKKIINSLESKPFMEIFLPDSDVLEVTDLIVLDGTNYQNVPLSEFFKKENKWYEVNSLSEQYVFVDYPQMKTDNNAIIVGKWEYISQRFITEYTDNGFLKIQFGGGDTNINSIEGYLSDSDAFLNKIQNHISNTSLGDYPRGNRTLFCKYRVGGGAKSNIGANQLTSLGDTVILVQGSNITVNNQVRNSLVVNNPIPALGGRDTLSIEEIRNLIKYNFSSQNRCVTINDYRSKILTMPGKFGSPKKTSIISKNGFIEISVLNADESGHLTNQSTSTLKTNIIEYLRKFKSENDYLIIKDGRIIHLAFEIDLFIDNNFNRNDIANTVIDNISDYMSINNREMGEDIHLSNLIEKINNVSGVLNVIDLRIYNKVGDGYSLNEISQSYLNENTRLIDTSNNILIADYNEMFEIKYKNKDIKIRFSV